MKVKMMKIIDLTYPHQLTQEMLPDTVCAIGFFDGVHLGHQKVIETAVKYAKQHCLQSAVITFYPHPKVVLSNGKQEVKYITPPIEKQRALKELGIDRLYTITFNKQLSLLLPEQFIDHFIIGLNIKHLVAGFDFTYGHKGQGNMTNIKDFAKDQFTYTVVEKVSFKDHKVSSTNIRTLIESGAIEQVNQLLGRPLQTVGQVITGNKRGRTIGFPTANIQVNDEALLPTPGVYAVEAIVNEQTYLGMANLGYRPTFEKDQQEPLLEVHLLDFQQNIYDKKLTVNWHTFVREEQKFSSIDELINQLKQDEQFIRKYFQNK